MQVAFSIPTSMNVNILRAKTSRNLGQQKKYPVAVAIFAEAWRLSPTNPVNVLMRAAALIYQASTIDFASAANLEHRNQLLNKAELALSQAYELSGKKTPIP
jgi:cytochrome c-type biogenesis protein CcmH/NrfG